MSSGIPAARDTAEKAIRWAWCRQQGRSPEDITVQRSDYWRWLCGQKWFSEGASLADQYPKVIEKLLGVKKERRDFFSRLISPGIPPAVGYRSLARILHEGWVTTVLTTNFDHCLEDARVLENKPHLLVTIKTSDDLIRFNTSPAEPQLIYLHGSVEHYTDRNLTSETEVLNEDLVSRLSALLRDHPIIVVGYRGTERSVMHGLFLDLMKMANKFAQGIYWCVRKSAIDQPLAPMVTQVAKLAGTNFQLVPIKGFDEFLETDIWDSMRTGGALPTRRDRGFRPVDTPADMKPLAGANIEEMEQSTLFSRLKEYAKRFGVAAPESFDRDWLEQECYVRNLLISVSDVPRPTVAGWLLFAREPDTKIPHAVVNFRAKGPRRWIAKVFGEDAIGASRDDPEITVEQDIRGNLWAQLNALTDLLALVNTGFRLKEEVSRTVYPYDSLALREALVNALVHRDYARTEAVVVEAFPDYICVKSPGGIISEVVAQIGEASLETVIRSGSRGIKGYRNPVITDLFYGGGQMDRSGSGLGDIWTQTANNNGEVHFGPDGDNRNFIVTLHARPEAVDRVTNTAVPLVTETLRYAANVLPFEVLPLKIWHAATHCTSSRALRREARDLAVPLGFVSDSRFYSFYDLESIAGRYQSPFDVADIEFLTLNELLALPNGEIVFLKLMYEAVFEHLRSGGLWVDYHRKRAYFPKTEIGERKITYHGRVKRATRTVVKARMRRGTDDIVYYEHKALGFSVMEFGGEWALIITPGYAFTRDGAGKPIGREKINVLSTRRAARDFNPTVHHDVVFWAATLSNEAEGVFALLCGENNEYAEYAPTIALSPILPTIAFSTVTSEAPRDPDEEEDELEDLDDEITALAIEEEQAEAEAVQAVAVADSKTHDAGSDEGDIED